MTLGERLQQFVFDLAWQQEPWQMALWHRVPILFVRRVWVIARDVASGELNLHAQSLVYVTLLSLVPLLAVSFSMLKSFGVHNQIEPFLHQMLAPLGSQGFEMSTKIMEFVENLKVGVLGALGLAMLLWTVAILLQRIEQALNAVWRVNVQRRLDESFTDYFSVIVIGPVLVFAAIGLMGTFMNSETVQTLIEIEPLGHLFKFLTQLVPYLLIVSAFTFVYTFVPNTEVQFGPAFLGAAVAGLLWQIAGWGFASFVVSSSKYTAIYSAFATLVLAIFWLYLGWLILLIGASVAFYLQHPEHIMPERRMGLVSSRLQEQIALSIMYLVCRDFYYGREPSYSLNRLIQQMNMPGDCLDSVLKSLENGNLIACTDKGFYIPACPLETTPLRAVIDRVRSAGEGVSLNADRLPREHTVEVVQEVIDGAWRRVLEGYHLKDLAMDRVPGGEAEQPKLPGIPAAS